MMGRHGSWSSRAARLGSATPGGQRRAGHPGIEVRVFGTTGAARCILSDDLPGAEGIWIAEADGHFRQADIPAHFSARMPETGAWWFRWPAHLIRSFVAEIGAGESAGPTFEDGVAAQEALAAVLHAVNERRWVDLPR